MTRIEFVTQQSEVEEKSQGTKRLLCSGELSKPEVLNRLWKLINDLWVTYIQQYMSLNMLNSY